MPITISPFGFWLSSEDKEYFLPFEKFPFFLNAKLEDLFDVEEIKKVDKHLDSNKLMFGEHHFSHAASAFYASPFEEAVVLTLDGVGEWATTTVASVKDTNLTLLKRFTSHTL